MISTMDQRERDQLEAWVAWANATLMQLVVVWFRTDGQRDSKWLGRLVGKRGGIACADTANMATRFAPWCRAILQPGERTTRSTTRERAEHPRTSSTCTCTCSP